jgi:hypothetical protein
MGIAASLLVAGDAVARTAVAAPPGPRFASEVVRLVATGAEQTVEGTYVFVNEQDSTRALILYPFPKDSLLGAPHLIDASISHGARPPAVLLVWADESGWHWTLSMAAGETCRVTIRYVQALAAPHAAYVLTSTRGWGRPLEHARLEVVLPENVRRPRFTFAFRKDGYGDGRCVWVYETKRFLPGKDLVVNWEAPPGSVPPP